MIKIRSFSFRGPGEPAFSENTRLSPKALFEYLTDVVNKRKVLQIRKRSHYNRFNSNISGQKEKRVNMERTENIFKRKSAKTHNCFTWECLGDIQKGRANLGDEMPVLVYRLLEFTMLDVLVKELGEEKAHDMFIKAGFLAGKELAKNELDLDQDFDGFTAQLQEVLRDLKIGILRIEAYDGDGQTLTLTVGEDLDCSGLPSTNE